MVSAEKDVFLLQRKAEMVGRMPRGGYRLEGQTRQFKTLAVSENRMGRVSRIMCGVETALCARAGRMWPRADKSGPGRGHETRGERTVIPVRVRDQNMRDPLAARDFQQGVEMGVILGSRIDDRHIAMPNNVCACAGEGERRRIGGDQPTKSRRDGVAYAAGRLLARRRRRMSRNGRIHVVLHRALSLVRAVSSCLYRYSASREQGREGGTPDVTRTSESIWRLPNQFRRRTRGNRLRSRP